MVQDLLGSERHWPCSGSGINGVTSSASGSVGSFRNQWWFFPVVVFPSCSQYFDFHIVGWHLGIVGQPVSQQNAPVSPKDFPLGQRSC